MQTFFRSAALILFAAPILNVLSCSQISAAHKKQPLLPQKSLERFQSAKQNEKADPEQSCALYSQLSQESFALQNLSLIKAHLICASDQQQALAPTPSDLLEREPWLALAQVDREPPAHVDPVPLKEIDEKDLPAAAQDLLSQREFPKARAVLKKIFLSVIFSAEDRYKARKAYRNSFKTEQKKDLFAQEAGRMAHWTRKTCSPAQIHEAYGTWARALWTLGKVPAAQKALIEAEEVLKKQNFALDEIHYIRARMAEESRKNEDALEQLKTAESLSNPGSPLRDRILFLQAWILRKQGKFQDAADVLLKLKNETQDPFDRNRYSFWLARSWKQAQKISEAEKEWKDLTQADPIGYYGLLSYRELKMDFPPLQAEKVENGKKEEKEKVANPKPFSLPDKDKELIQALTFVDESEVLRQLLDLKTTELRGHHVTDSETWLYFLRAYAEAGLYNPLFQQIGTLPNEIKTTFLTRNPESLFPRRYADLVQSAATKFSVRPELVLSIIRQESAFNPLARSGADALGLMQILPSVAKKHEKKTGIHLEHFEDLHLPEKNIPIGTSLLADLNKKYKGQFLLVAAAYNANEKAIRTWLKTRLQDDPVEFIEEIPYEETRSYVKLVLRNFIFYSRLAKPTEKTPFPDWCLEDLHSFKVSTR